MAIDNKIIQRSTQADNSRIWEDDNFGGLYTGSNSTFMAAYLYQNITAVEQTLVVLFQSEDFANGITQALYTGRGTTSNSWTANNFSFLIAKGSTFTISSVNSYGRPVMLYTVDESMHLQQHEYSIGGRIAPNNVLSPISTSCKYPPYPTCYRHLDYADAALK